MDRDRMGEFATIGVVRGRKGSRSIDVCPDRLVTRGPIIPTKDITVLRVTADTREGSPLKAGKSQTKRKASESQIQYIQSLISEWDPNPGGWGEVDGASKETLAGALEIAGVIDYENPRSFRRLNMAQAGDIIDALKKYDP